MPRQAMLDNPTTGPTYTIEGFGASVTGGDQAGQTVYTVTNLNNTGAGSLRDAVENHTGPRLVVFDVSGTIDLSASNYIEISGTSHGDLTIDGSDAPNGGICLKGGGLHFTAGTTNVIIRHIRVRGGSTQPSPSNANSLQFETCDHIVIDHCSVSWGIDQVTGFSATAQDITIQWSTITEGLDGAGHPEGGHSDGSLITDKATNITIHHCLYEHSNNRNPLLNGQNNVDIVNNVIYDGGVYTVISPEAVPSDPTATNGIHANIVNNYYKQGPQDISLANGGDPINTREITLRGTELYSSVSSVYIAGNIGINAPTGSENQNLVYYEDNGPFGAILGSRLNYPQVTTETAANAKISVLAGVGATLPRRDSVDARLVYQVDNGLIRSGTLQSGNTSLSVKLDSGASSVDDAYTGYGICLPGYGQNGGQGRKIVAYNGSTKVATVQDTIYTPPYSPVPSAGQAFRIYYGYVILTEDDVGGYPDLTQPAGNSSSVRLAYHLS